MNKQQHRTGETTRWLWPANSTRGLAPADPGLLGRRGGFQPNWHAPELISVTHTQTFNIYHFDRNIPQVNA